jgi:hypothetical protein
VSFDNFDQSTSPSGWLKISNEDPGATATNVMPQASAALTAKAVGADIAIRVEHPIAAVFCTSSIEIRLGHEDGAGSPGDPSGSECAGEFVERVVTSTSRRAAGNPR